MVFRLDEMSRAAINFVEALDLFGCKEENPYKDIKIDKRVLPNYKFNEIDFNNKEQLKEALKPYQSAILKLFGRYKWIGYSDNFIHKRLKVLSAESFEEKVKNVLENRSKDSGILRVIGKGVCDHRERNSTIFINGACYHKEDVIVHENLHRLSNKPPENKVTFRIRKVNGKVRAELRVMRVYKSGICESYFDEFGNFVKHKYLELKEGIDEVLTTYVMETAGSTATSHHAIILA